MLCQRPCLNPMASYYTSLGIEQSVTLGRARVHTCASDKGLVLLVLLVICFHQTYTSDFRCVDWLSFRRGCQIHRVWEHSKYLQTSTAVCGIWCRLSYLRWKLRREQGIENLRGLSFKCIRLNFSLTVLGSMVQSPPWVLTIFILMFYYQTDGIQIFYCMA